MRFVFGKQDMTNAARAQENCWLLGNGLGGFSSTTAAFSVTRNDHSILVAARTAPNDRVNLVHRLSEKLMLGSDTVYLSTQDLRMESLLRMDTVIFLPLRWNAVPAGTMNTGVSI